jgi:hypothetical protein
MYCMAAEREQAVADHWRRFGQWLEEQRLFARLSATEASKRADMHLTSWSRLENGQAGTKRTTLPRILSALGIRPDDARYLEGFRLAGFVVSYDIPGPIQNNPDAPVEARELHDDERSSYDKWYFAFEGEPGFSKLSPSEKDALVRRAVEAERQPNTFKPGDFRRAVEEAQKQRQSEE